MRSGRRKFGRGDWGEVSVHPVALPLSPAPPPPRFLRRRRRQPITSTLIKMFNTYIAWYLRLSMSDTEGPIDDAACSKSDRLISIPPAGCCFDTSVADIYEERNKV